jgi:hypothetical protein
MSKIKGHVLNKTLLSEASAASVSRPTWQAEQRVKTAPDKKKTNITFFLALSTHKRLKEIALERNTSLQQIVAQAVDEWLAREADGAVYKPKD